MLSLDKIFADSTDAKLYDQLTPIFIMDPGYQIIDWNRAFARFFAEPIGIVKGSYVGDMLEHFEDFTGIRERAVKVFKVGQLPLQDIEEQAFDSPDFGMIRFKKIASQLRSNDGEQIGWICQLCIMSVEVDREFWAAMGRLLEANYSLAD